MTDPVLSFSEQGYAILQSAVDHLTIDDYLKGLEAADSERLMLIDHETGVRSYHCLEDQKRLRVPLNRLTETHWALPQARGLFSDSIVAFLQQALHSSQVLCFETFHHEVGLGMRMHREGWYVRLRDGGAAAMATVWIALADIEEGGGELQYSPGSHLPTGYDDPQLHDAAAHEHVVSRFGSECAVIQRFSARKGDVLITRGDLGVGGALVAGECRMFVAHFCSLQDEPAYFANLAPEFRVKRQLTRELYSSTVYVGKY